MKGMRAIKVSSPDSDSHYYLVEATALNISEYRNSLSKAKAKRITKMEAQRLLLMIREE